MAQFSVNAQRFDPYKNFKFRVKWDGRYVAGISKVGALKRTTEVVKHREGGDPSSTRKSPGKTDYEAITLERGVTHDLEFEQWANKGLLCCSRAVVRPSCNDFTTPISTALKCPLLKKRRGVVVLLHPLPGHFKHHNTGRHAHVQRLNLASHGHAQLHVG